MQMMSILQKLVLPCVIVHILPLTTVNNKYDEIFIKKVLENCIKLILHKFIKT